MAVVPGINNGGNVEPGGLPSVRVNTDVTGGVSGAQMQSMGKDVQGIAAQYTMLQNQVRVNDAMNQVRQKALDLTYDPQQGYQAKKGSAALQPDANGQALPQAYGTELGSTIDDVASTLTPVQQRVFRQSAQDLHTTFVGGVQQHMLQQGQAYALSVQDSTQKLTEDMAGQFWNQPDKITGTANPTTGQYEGGLVQQAQASAYATAKLTGLDPQAAIMEAGSRIHTAVIRSALENQNPQYAADYLAAHKSGMTTDDILRVQGLVTQQATAQMVQGAVSKAATTLQPSVAPTDMDRLTGLVSQQESGGNPNAIGPNVPGQGTAKGSMQVMDATAKNPSLPGFPIQPAKTLPDGSIDPADRARVGRDYLAALVKKYGNVPQALAAYNAGPDTVDKAIAAATSVGEPDLWLQSMGDFQSDANHQQTVNYVQAISAKYGQGGGAAPMPTKEQFVQNVTDALGPGATPAAITMARQSAEARYTLSIQSRDEQGDQAVRQAQQAIIANGGDMSVFVRDNPDMASAVRQFAPGKFDDLVKFSRSIAKGENITNMDAYGAAVTYPQDLAKLSDSDMAQLVNTQMSQADGRYLYKLRAEVQSGKVDMGPEALNQAALNSKLTRAMRDIGLNPSATDADSKTRIGDVQQAMASGILAQQKALNKKFTAADIDQYVDQQIARGTVVPRWFGLSSTTQSLYSTQIGDISDADKAAISKQLVGEGLQIPTDSQILRRYIAVKANGK